MMKHPGLAPALMGHVRSRNTPGVFRCMQKKDLKLRSKIELAATIVKDKDGPFDETRDWF